MRITTFLNKLYIADEFKAEDLDKLLKLAKKIRSNDPTRKLCVIFDDSVGMAKGLFSGSKAKRLLTTLRHYGISVIVSTQQLQNEVTTLLRNNIQEVFLFAQSEPYGLQLAYDTWGKSSSNLKDKSEFEKCVASLPRHNFLHYSRKTQLWSQGQIPYPLPQFRIYLHPSDLEAQKEGMIVLNGNKENYDLSLVERDLSIQQVEADDNKPLFRSLKEPKDTSDIENDLDDKEIEKMDSDSDLSDDPVEKHKRKNPKKRSPPPKKSKHGKKRSYEAIEKQNDPVQS